MDRSAAEHLLRRALGNSEATFRGGQWEAIDSLVNHRHRLLLVQRTGWGKSAVYFISTRILRDRGAGLTVIISPLLALMRNQIDAADRLGIRAKTINSTNVSEWKIVTEEILADRVDVLLISPERLANERFVEDVLRPIANRIGLLVVDEAHCISDWGHDFRPDYRRLVLVLRQLPPGVPVLGTTATASDRVVRDIEGQIANIRILRGPLMRESLVLQTIRLPDQATRLAWLAENIPNMQGTGIVYTLTVRDAEDVARWLQESGIEAHAYHSGIEHPDFESSDAYRRELERLLLDNEMKVLVATTALGMGYDKPDLAFVVHYQAPSSVVGYYQQVGRAGRAIETAYGILLSGREDADIHEFFRRTAFPDEVHVTSILDAVEQNDGLTLAALSERVNLSQGQLSSALKYLSVENPAPVIKDGSKWRRTPVRYEMDHESIARLTRQREMEWSEVQQFIGTQECLMLYLSRALDDIDSEPCGRCANCRRQPILPVDFPPDLGAKASRFLRQADVPLETKKQVASGAFEIYKLRGNIPEPLRAREGRILSRWGDAGWGRLVAQEKQTGRFSDELVDALAAMITKRWRPEPGPEWVTFVPSRQHPRLVADLARRLATALGLPVIEAIVKVRENEPQKLQRNRFHQCRNLDGAFQVMDVLAGPVLLVDDIVDSGWTLTVLTALLRQAGSGEVYPVALATSSPGG